MLVAQRKELLLERLRRTGGSWPRTSPPSWTRPRTRSAATCASSPPPGCASASTAARSRPPRPPPTTRAGRRSRPRSKARVAAACLELIRPGSTLILDGGTTALEVARALPHDLGVTVITHSPTIAVALVDHPGRGLHPRRAAVQALRRRLRRRRGRGRGAGHRRPVPAGRHGRAPGHRADDRRRRRGGDEAHALAPRGRDLGDGERGEDRRGVAVPGARGSTRSPGSSATPTRSTRCWPSWSARACGSCRRNSAAPQASSSPEGNQQ